MTVTRQTVRIIIHTLKDFSSFAENRQTDGRTRIYALNKTVRITIYVGIYLRRPGERVLFVSVDLELQFLFKWLLLFCWWRSQMVASQNERKFHFYLALLTGQVINHYFYFKIMFHAWLKAQNIFRCVCPSYLSNYYCKYLNH